MEGGADWWALEPQRRHNYLQPALHKKQRWKEGEHPGFSLLPALISSNFLSRPPID